MHILICGAGEVGTHTAEVLDESGHDITVIDTDEDRLAKINESMDVRTFQGNCANADILREAGAEGADAIVAAVDSDEVNLLTAAVARGIGVKKAIARVHHSAYFEQRGLDYQSHLGIAQLICPEYSTALAIADTVCNPGALAIESFARGRIEMQEFAVSDGAPAVGKPLKDVSFPPGTRLAAITRDHQAFLPEASTVVQPGDVVVLVGNASVFERALGLFHLEEAGRRRLVIMGGSPTAVWVARELKGKFSIRIFETDRARAESIAEKLDWVTVINADPIDPSVFLEEHISRASAFVALLDDDEHNILACAYAKSMGVPEVIAIAQRQTFLHLLHHIGIDHVFSPRRTAAREIALALDESPLVRMASLAEGIIDAYRVRVGRRAPVSLKPLKEVPLSPDWMVAAVQHGDQVRVPVANDSLQAGDIALVIGRDGQEKKLKKLFALK